MFATRVMNVLTATEREQRRLKMIFTIDAENNITAFANAEEAVAATSTPFESFASEKELAALAGTWPAGRLTAIWNSLPGVKEIQEFRSAKAGAARIWQRIQKLGDATEIEQKPKGPKKAAGSAKTAKGARAKGRAVKQATGAKKAHKTERSAKSTGGLREGSKTAEVVALLQRKNGATITEIMEKMGWQKHTVRGFMAGAMKKAAYEVESFKLEGGERTYRINK
jgi:hypothetical protein